MTPKFGAWILATASCLFAPLAGIADSKIASSSLLEKAEAGDPAAQLALGLAAEDNETKPDYATAAKWYLLASDAGSGMADWQLGMLYETGDGVPQSYYEARTCYERAVTRGVVAANLRLGFFYLEGWGVKPDRAKMLELVKRAAESGYEPAMNVLSDMFMSGIGAPRDAAQALKWAERAARLDNPNGQLAVGTLTMQGTGVRRDIALARDWYQLSAEQEYTTAMLAMASTFLRKGATPYDHATGTRWLELALENGSRDAGFLLAMGELGPPDGETPHAESRARAFLEKARSLNCMNASEVLEREKAGQSFREALWEVATVPMEVRYVDQAARAAAKDDPANHPPRALRAVNPVYPASMRLANQEGVVVLEFTVDTQGRVRDASVLSSPHPAFTESALQMAQQFRFSPGMKDGRVVNMRVRIPVYFNLSG